jgi:transposase
MTTLRRKYTQEYKREAVALVHQSKQPISHIAKSLSINESMLRRWVKELADPSQKAFTGCGNPRDEELARLKRELVEVKRERDFLREAAAYFAKQPK